MKVREFGETKLLCPDFKSSNSRLILVSELFTATLRQIFSFIPLVYREADF